jgi:hypothetical protein
VILSLSPKAAEILRSCIELGIEAAPPEDDDEAPIVAGLLTSLNESLAV